MNEQEQSSQLSALFDGALPSQQAELVIRRALKDNAMRQRWQRYAVIGACLRGEPLAGVSNRNSVAERVAARLAAEPEILAPSRKLASAGGSTGGRFASLYGRGAMGGAIAAAVAVVAVFVVRSIAPITGETGTLVAQRDVPVAGTTQDNAAPGYTTPGANTPAAKRVIELQPLAHYVVAHSEQAASSFGFSYDLTEGAVDMTEDEIEAHR